MTSALRRGALLSLVLPVLALGACGGDDKKDTTTAAAAPTTPATTAPAGGGTFDRAALAEQANAVCKVTNAASNALTAPPTNADKDHLSAFYAKLATLAAQQQARLEALAPDAATKEEWAAFLALTREATDLVQGIAPAVKVDSSKSATIIQRVSALSPKINAAADALGARTCGSDSGKS